MPDAYNPWGAPVFPTAADNAMQPETFVPQGVQQWTQQAAPKDYNILSQIAGSLGKALMYPGQVAQSKVPISTEDMIAPAFNMASMLTLGAGAAPAEANSVRTGMSFPLYHGSPQSGLTEIAQSQRGALGPGAYFTPADNVAARYGDNVYQLPEKSRDIFNGLGDKYGSYEGWKSDKARLLAAAEPDKQAELSAIMDKMWTGDGYPMHTRISQMYRDEGKAQDLYRRAGFEGYSGHADGPEVVLFDKQPLTAPAPMGIKAYHGSPHDFEKFDLSKIGTGEGAQAYGHGLYFAENPAVAKEYRDALATQDKGKMYEVNINADPSHFLDWDRPLSPDVLAKVQSAAQNIKPSLYERMMGEGKDLAKWALQPENVKPGLTGESAVGSLKRGLGSDAAASQALREAGIPGIKYLDEGSRNPWDVRQNQKGFYAAENLGPGYGGRRSDEYFPTHEAAQQWADKQQTRNYVVFNHDIVDIMRKYAVPGMLGAPILANALSEQKT